MGIGHNINIKGSLEKVDSNPMDDYEGFKTSVEEVTTVGNSKRTRVRSRARSC